MARDKQRRQGSAAGFSLLEVLIAVIVLALAGLVGAAYSVRGSADADWNRDRAFANQKALAILAELRGLVVSGETDVAEALDAYDDEGEYYAPLTITENPEPPYGLVAPDHPVSGNVMNAGVWRWSRSISVEEFEHQENRNRRRCTVRIYRRLPHEVAPGIQMAEVSGVIQTADDRLPGGQVYDLYVLAIENVPSPWLPADGIEAFLDSSVSDLRSRNPGLDFRVHMIERLGYGRDDEYAPYANVTRTTTDKTPWAYVYPGTLPEGGTRATHYAPSVFRGRYNRDGEKGPTFLNEYRKPELFTDTNDNGDLDPEEVFGDEDADGDFDPGNNTPYAFADAHNHALRAPQATVRHEARVADRSETEPTWRQILDQMVRDPEQFHNALFLNLHGHILPMPPVRNYSDAARMPDLRPGWRVVTHPERLRPARVQGNDLSSQAPRFRVYAYKTEFTSTEQVMTLGEPYEDVNGNGLWDADESFTDWNDNGARDASLPISLLIPGGDFTAAPNAATSPSIKILALAGGVDADGDGTAEPYKAFSAATRLPESFSDANGDGIRNLSEPWLDLDGNGVRDASDPFTDLDGDGQFSSTTETITDQNGNGRWDRDIPAESFTDANGNGSWDAAEPYWDYDGDGKWTPPKEENTYEPWDTKDWGISGQEKNYVKAHGEPFFDRDGDGAWDDAEDFEDANGNGVCDAGYARGEMFYTLRYFADINATVVFLHGTPLEAPQDATGAGLAADARLYDLSYIPCPTPATADAVDRFGRDLSVVGDFPKNTARWIVELPTAAIRTQMSSGLGATPDGDAYDRVISVETRMGNDLTTGTLWPIRNLPANRSITHAWFCDSVEDVPYSERFQFQGDPRHSPYADTDARGSSFPNGYNWFFDDFQTGATSAQDQWLAFDATRLKDRWAGRSDLDVPRYMDWLRRGLCGAEAFFTNVGGLAFSTISVGGDIGGDAPDLDASVLMDGTPFGLDGDVQENTLYTPGTAGIAGGSKIVRDGVASEASRRAGGGWWSKPWLGEICPDALYAQYWIPAGNLKAGTGEHAGHFRRVLRSDAPTGQQPVGTRLGTARNELGVLGGTCFFNTGSASSTFQQSGSSAVALLHGNGRDLGSRYGLALPIGVSVSHPFLLDWSGDTQVNGLSVGPAFGDTATYPRYSASLATTYYTEQARDDTAIGSAFVRLADPDGHAARIGISSLYPGTEDGVAFLTRYALISFVHAHAAEGHPSESPHVRQLPALTVDAPAGRAHYPNPAFIDVKWSLLWSRWDSGLYDMDYPDGFAEDEGNLVYRLLYSNNDGASWHYLHDHKETTPGFLPRHADGSPDMSVCVADGTDGDETYTWATPAAAIPDASYRIRIEAYHVTDLHHYAYMEERFDVSR